MQPVYVTFVPGVTVPLFHIPPPVSVAEQVLNVVSLILSCPEFLIPPPLAAVHNSKVQPETAAVTPPVLHIPPPSNSVPASQP